MSPGNSVVDLVQYIADAAKLGAWALGIFVGWLLGYALLNSKPGLKAALTVLGAALGGGPILFLSDAGDAKWIYPIGLLLGLLMVRIPGARTAIANKYSNPSKHNQVHGWFAWTDILVISGAAAAALIYVVTAE
jgi:hypothetical protein